MFRRDYIIAGIEQFAAMLAKITGLAKNEEWPAAADSISQEFQRLAGVNAAQIDRMSDMELLASLVQGEPSHTVENKAFMLAALLKAGGDVSTAEGRVEEGRRRYLKGLHLLLDVFGRNETISRPDFVPTVETFLAALSGEPLPVETRVMLMRHYEQTGEFGKAEDMLFAILDVEPRGPEVLGFGTSFYQRLLARSDAALEAGNLPRSEAQAGLEQLRNYQQNPS